jgi:protein-S-isoprenylcysteine O-methyltransferase Ste14
VATVAQVGNLVCWGAFALVWLVGAVYNAVRGPRRQDSARFGSLGLAAGAVLFVALAHVGAGRWQTMVVTEAWVRLLGLAVLVVSTAFTLWARFSLGVMWSSAPIVKSGHRLRTGGPYRLTRHPIYTGLLGMLLGSTLLDGVGPWVVAVPIALILLEVKIRMEERLMLATFPAEYAAYRERVPQLVPGGHVLRRHRTHAA